MTPDRTRRDNHAAVEDSGLGIRRIAATEQTTPSCSRCREETYVGVDDRPVPPA